MDSGLEKKHRQVVSALEGLGGKYTPEYAEELWSKVKDYTLSGKDIFDECLTRARYKPEDTSSTNGQEPPPTNGQEPPQAKEFKIPPPEVDDTDYFVPSTEYQDVPDWAALPNGAEVIFPMGGGTQQARWNDPVPGPETVIDKRTRKPQAKRPGHQKSSTAAGAASADAGPKKEQFKSKIPPPEVYEAKTYKPKGSSPIGHRKRGVVEEEILLGDGFLERGTAGLLAGSSGIGKSSVAMQMGCCWSCGNPAFYLAPPRPLRIVMIQNEDSDNDLARMSEVTQHLGLEEKLIDRNFWIETVRGKVGKEAVSVMRDLVEWHRADILLINPLSAYHSGDISNNKDNIAFLYGELGELLAESRCGIFGFHHKGKPPKNLNQQNSKKAEDIYFEIMYDILGGSVLTNFFRGIIAVSPIGNSEVFRFALAKRFLESGWDQKFQMFKWHEDREKRLWVPASTVESDKAKVSGKTLEDLYKLAPVLGTIPREAFEHAAIAAGFTRIEYRGLLAQALDDLTPDELRLYQWSVYNPHGLAKAYYSRVDQPGDETHAVIKEAETRKRKAAQKAEAEAAKAAKKAKSQPEK